MSKEEMVEPGRVMPTYSGFVILRVNEIWGIWKEGDPEQALKLAVRLANTFLPKKLKKRLRHDAEVIRKDINKAYSFRSVDFYQTEIGKNREVRRTAALHIGPFLDKLSDLLDEWGYYEMPSRRLKPSDFKELESEKVEGKVG